MIRLNETNPRLDRRNTFVDESHSGHVANYLVHDLIVPARRRETEGSPLFPRCSGRSPIDSSPRSGSGFSFESSLRGGALRSALGKSSSRALELPFYDSAFIEACTFQSGPRHNRSAYAPRHHGEGASNRREYHPNQPYPRESGGRGEGGDFLSGNTRASSSNPRIYATLAWILRDCKDGRGGWSSEEGERGKGGDSFPMIYSTVFLTSITWPNNCRFIEDLYRWLKKND